MAGIAVDPVVVATAVNSVAAGAAEQTVIAREGDQQVVAGQARDGVGFRTSIDFVSDLVVARGPRRSAMMVAPKRVLGGHGGCAARPFDSSLSGDAWWRT